MNAFAGFISLNHDAVTAEKIQAMAAGLVAWKSDETYFSGDSKARFVQLVRHNLPESVYAPQTPGFLHDMHMDAGEYVYAKWDSQSETLTASRDPMGHRLLYYTHQPGKFFAFSTTIPGLLVLPEISKRPNLAKFEGQLNLESPYPEDSFYKGVKRLLPGHHLELQAGCLKTWAFYDPFNIKEVRFKRDSEYQEAFLELFDRAVKSRMRSIFPIGAHLSGGLDSSCVVAMAVKDAAPLTTFSAFPPLGYTGPTRANWNLDDTKYVMTMKQKYPQLDTVFVRSVGRDYFTGLGQVYPYWDGPCLNPCNRIWIDEIFEEASTRNIRTILTGAMGNATISWRGYTLKQQLGWLARAPMRFLQPSRWGVKDPRAQMIFKGVIRDTQAYFSAERAYWGIELRDPTHDQKLVEFCLGLPNSQFARGNQNRGLVRNFMAGILPDEIRLRRDQGAQLGHWPMLLGDSMSQIKTEWPQVLTALKSFSQLNTSYLLNLIESWSGFNLDLAQVSHDYRFIFLRTYFLGRYLGWMLNDGRGAAEKNLGTARVDPNFGCCPGY